VTVWTIVLAAGGGSRFGGRKQFATVAGERAVDRVVRTARTVSSGVVVVLPAGILWGGPPVEAVVTGGATRAASVRCGLAAVPEQAQVVLVHDAAHPLASSAQFRAVLTALHEAGADAALPAVPLVEALKSIDGARVTGHPSRSGLVQAQMPHAFRAAALRAAHADAPEATEDVELVCAAGGRAVVVEGDPRNVHITTPEELEVADALATAWRRRD
jgi:2-C-methyl-D-erythritol 4-phosphate cytidylyltransferase